MIEVLLFLAGVACGVWIMTFAWYLSIRNLKSVGITHKANRATKG